MKNKLFVLVNMSISLLFFYGNLFAATEVLKPGYQKKYVNEKLSEDYNKIKLNILDFFDKQTSKENGLIESFRNTSNYVFDDGEFFYSTKGVLDNQAFTYDNACAVLAYICCGHFNKAKNILEVFRKEFYVPKTDEAKMGLYNSYLNNVPAKNGALQSGIDGDRMHVGPNLWIALAGLQYTAVTGDLEFLPFVIDMSKWVDSLNHFKLKDGSKGAVSMGFGWGPDWHNVYSTENIVDDYAVLKMLKYIYLHCDKNVQKMFKKNKYPLKKIEKEMKNIENWMMQVAYDKTKKTFNQGYDGTKVDVTDALDSVSWTICALEPEKLVELGVDPYHLMDWADKNYYATEVMDTQLVEGFDFTNPAGRGEEKKYRMVWFEGTGFHIVAMQRMSEYATKTKKFNEAKMFANNSKYYLNEMQKAYNVCKMNALPYASKKTADKTLYTTFKWEWEIPRGKNGLWVPSASSSAWYLLALSGFDPLSFNFNAVKYKLFETDKTVAVKKK